MKALGLFGPRFDMDKGAGAEIRAFLKKKGEDDFVAAIRPGLEQAAEGAKNAIRAAGRNAGLGNLAKAWRVRRVDRGGFDVVFYVVPKGRGAIKALRAFTTRRGPTVVRPSRSDYLAIPLPAAGQAAGRPKNIGRAPFDVRRLDPQRWEVENKRRLFPITAGGKRYLVARSKGGGLDFIFTLVPQSVLRQRFDWRPIAEDWKRRSANLIMTEYRKLARQGQAGDGALWTKPYKSGGRTAQPYLALPWSRR